MNKTTWCATVISDTDKSQEKINSQLVIQSAHSTLKNRKNYRLIIIYLKFFLDLLPIYKK